MTIPMNGLGNLALPGFDGAGAAGGAGSTGGADATGTTSGGKGFAAQLSNALQNLNNDQATGNAAANSIATGQSKDIAQTMMQVEQASMSLELATQVRNKAVEAYQNIMQMQV